MLIAYIDDSGTHDGSHNSVLGGYWGSKNEWRRFERAWKAVLDSEGISEFHANKFWQRIAGKGRLAPYTAWDDERHRDFINRLLRAIESTKIVPFACGVSPAEWSNLAEERIEIFTSREKRLQKPLGIALYRIIYRLASYIHSHKVMHFVMDLDKAKPSVQQAMLTIFDDVKDSLKRDNDPLVDRLGELTFAESHKAIPLQAADLLVYEAHRYAKRAKGDKNFPVRAEYGRALSRFKSKADFWFFDQERLANLNKFIDQAENDEAPTI